VVFGVRSSADHYTAPLVHTTSPKIPTFFDLVVKKPVTDIATSMEAFCLSGVDGECMGLRVDGTNTYGCSPGVIGKLVKGEALLREEVVSLIGSKLRTSLLPWDIQGNHQDVERLPGAISKGDVNRMNYKTFDESITRKHGIVIEGWPLREFKNPSAIGSQVELKVLLNAWQSGVARFRKMPVGEHMAWVENRAAPEPSALTIHHSPPVSSPSLSLAQDNNQDLTPTTNFPVLHAPFNIIQLGPPTTQAVGSSSVGSAPKKPRKTRSDKGKSRKKTSHPGVGVFHMNAS